MYSPLHSCLRLGGKNRLVVSGQLQHRHRAHGREQDQAGRREGESRIRQGGERGRGGRVEADLCGAAVKTALIKASSQLVVSRSVWCEI